MRRKPPDILITTPESLYLILASQAREMLTGVEAVIVDEIHAVAQSKRGAHLALTLERLEELVRRNTDPAPPGREAENAAGNRNGSVQRIGLSAIQRPLERIAQFLVGPRRECEIVDAGRSKELIASRSASWSRTSSRTRRSRSGATGGDPASPSPPTRTSMERQPALDLARDLSRAAEARPRAHIDDHLRQQPPRRRATRKAPQRAPRTRRRRLH